MDEYIKREDAIRNVASVTTIYAEDSAMKSLCLNALLATPTADVVPKSEVAREIIAKFKTKMHSEIARNELLAEYGDDFYEGRIDAFLTAIECLAEIVMEYCSSAQNEGIDV